MSTPPEPHPMVQTDTAASGAEEWACTQCPRRLRIRWSPEFERLVLERGDETAAHAGGNGGLAIRGVSTAPSPAAPTGHDRAWLAQQGITWDQRSAS